jgi:hypothetical protein
VQQTNSVRSVGLNLWNLAITLLGPLDWTACVVMILLRVFGGILRRRAAIVKITPPPCRLIVAVILYLSLKIARACQVEKSSTRRMTLT